MLTKIILLIILFINFSSGGEILKPIPTSVKPIIDGNLDDDVWKNAVMVTGFRTFIPDFGKVMPESTVVLTSYDKENLYFAFKCFDPDPKTIKAEITNRDNLRPHDWVCINLDSFNDKQTIYGFYVNPLGIQADSKFAAQAEDHGVDFVWYSAGKIHNEGYNIEIQIPFKSIRYKDTNPVTMSVVFERRVSRRSEQATYPALDPKKGYQFLIQMLPMEFSDIEHYTLFELIPSTTLNNKSKLVDSKLVNDVSKNEISLTSKYGITSDLILDATYNPDFSQVEADAGQVDLNLRYGLFFPEKRPFFLEGSEIFNLAGTSHDRMAVHTRTIVNPKVGLKLTGKLSDKSTIASVFAVDELLDGNSNTTGSTATFPIIRYKYSLEDDSYLGGIYTGREMDNHYNRVAGVDGMIRVTPSSFATYQTLFSETKLNDSTENTFGDSYLLSYRYTTRDLDYHIAASNVSKNYSAETGYQTRTGIFSISGGYTPKFYTSSALVKRFDLDFYSVQTKDSFSDLWEYYNSINIKLFVLNNLNFSTRFNYSTEIYNSKIFETSGFNVTGGGQFTKQLNVSLNYRISKSINYSESYQGYNSRINTNITFQPWDQLDANLNATHVAFYKTADNSKIYEYPIFRGKLTYQLNQYFFLRGVAEYNDYKRTLLTDFLSSFTYIPFTTLYVGYGSLYQKNVDDVNNNYSSTEFLEMKRGLFIKASYLWRM